MITVVIIFNLSLAIACLYGAKRMGQLRFALARAADALIAAEQATARALSPAPSAIEGLGDRCFNLRQCYQELELRLGRVQRLMALLGMTRWVWQVYGRRSKHLQRITANPPRTARPKVSL
jgi:hypothetical protein